MVTFNQFRNGVANFMDMEMVNKITDPTTKVLTSAFLIATQKKAENIFNSLKDNPLVKMYDLIDENGNIDVDMMYECLKVPMQSTPLVMQLPFIGKTTFNVNDLENLKNHIIRADNI